MARGAMPDPTRARRGTGNRPATGAAKPSKAVQLAARDQLAPPAPEHLPAEAHELWDLLVAELHPRGLRPGDLEAVRQMVLAAHRHRQAQALVDRHGLMVEVRGRAQVNPALRIERDSAKLFMQYADAFGLTMAARVRLGLMQLAGESLLQTLNRELDGG
jgi:P27 family predicted phage terminase small subunit